MGFYDYRCAVTGLSLRAERAVMIWLWRSGKEWTPVSLPIRGQYDRLGAIYGFKRDFNTVLLTDAFRDALEVGQLTLAGDAAYSWSHPRTDWNDNPLSGIDLIISVIERSTTMGWIWGKGAENEGVRFAGRLLTHTLISERVWDAVLENAGNPKAELATPAMVDATFPSELGRAMYADLPAPVRERAGKSLDELIRFRAWFEERAKWAPGGDAHQHGRCEDLAFHCEARRRFGDVPWMVKVVDRISRDREKEDAEDLPERWLHDAFASWYGLTVGGQRVARTSLAGLRRAVEALVLNGDVGRLTQAPAAVFTVQRGATEQQLDLRPLIRLSGGDKLVTLDRQPEAEELASRPGAAVKALVNWDEIEQQLAKLEEPLAARGSQRFVPVLGAAPAWAKEDERWGLIRFAAADQ